MTELEPTGFVVYTDEAIYGTGATRQAAISNAHEWMDRETAESDYTVAPATAALLAEVEDRGGAIAWRRIGGIACTLAEADTGGQ